MKSCVLITGASGGIGKALADVFAMHGHDLLLVARRKELLEKIADEMKEKYHVQVFVYPLDLRQEHAAEELHAYCVQNDIHVEILINNAGIGAQGSFVDIALEKQEKIIALNVSAVVRMCHVFLKDMQNKRQGTIVNICSTTAFMPLANEAVYAASKAFILSFSQALYEEMKPYGVTVCTICPGVTKTDFFKSAEFQSEYFKGADPDDFARFAYKKIIGKRALYIYGVSNLLIDVWAKIFPRSFVRKVSGRFG